MKPLLLLPLLMNSLTASQPNVVLIMTDDQGWGDVGIHGNALIETPNLDSLARESIRFPEFYVHPVCAATRASLLTGRHYLRTGVAHVHGGRDFMHPDEVTIAEWFRANGYATGMWGKWHSGSTTGYLPWERGFEEAYKARLYVHHDGHGEFNGAYRDTPGWTTDVITDMALDFIERHQDQAFFAYIPHLAPHAPLAAKPELVEKYRNKGLGETIATAFAMVEMVDHSVGRILSRLHELGLAENTIVIFLSDNGPQYFGADKVTDEEYALRSIGLKGHKGSMWENGIRVPFFLRFPQRFEPRVAERFADVHDILPTLIDLCELSPPERILPMDGRSLVPICEGKDAAPKQSVIFSNVGWPPVKGDRHPWPNWQKDEFHPVSPVHKPALEYYPHLMGLRTEGFKLLRNPGYAKGAPATVDSEVLIDMREDNAENNNLVCAHPLLAEVMRGALADWFAVIKTEPHAFHVPRFAIGPGTTNQLFLYAPIERLGNAWNAALDSRDWITSGDGGRYLLDVRKGGMYALTLTFLGSFETEFPVLLQLDNQPATALRALPGNAPFAVLELPYGFHRLTLVRDEGGPDTSGLRLHRILFEPRESDEP